MRGLVTGGERQRKRRLTAGNWLLMKPLFRLTVEWFLSQENNWWIGWKWITQKIRIFYGRFKWRLERLGALETMGKAAPLTLSLPRVINFNLLFQSLTRDISYSMENFAIDSLLK